MKEIIAVLRMNMMNKTKRALADAGISSMTAVSALGRGKGLVDISLLRGAEKGYEEAVAQLGETPRLIPKRLLLVVVPDKLADKTIIFVTSIANAVSVRTCEQDDSVLDGA